MKTSKIIIVIQQVGGVGKTFIATHLLHMLEHMGFRFTAVDFDSNGKAGIINRMLGSTARLLPPTIESVLTGDNSEFGKLLTLAMQAGNNYMIDCGANYADKIYFFFQSRPGLLEELAANGVSITVVIPVNSVRKGQTLFPIIAKLIPGATAIQVKISGNYQKFEVPPHDPDLCVNLEWANEDAWRIYQDKAMTAFQLATTLQPELLFEADFGKAYAEIFTNSFSKVKNHLIPHS